ncbi:MAG: RDD family protein [Rubrivivax sp.]|nr:RDD family protein [Rubrivivax sp.]
MTPAAQGGPALPAPGLRRRMAAFVYEGVLLFGVLMVTGLVYGLATQQRHAMVGLHGLQAFVFVVLGLYFTWFWSHGGQTIAMKTWHIRLLTEDGRPVGAARAWLRYLLSWLWFMPALVWAWLNGLHSGLQLGVALLVGVVAYAALARCNRHRQFLHDLLARTRLVQTPPPPRRQP